MLSSSTVSHLALCQMLNDALPRTFKHGLWADPRLCELWNGTYAQRKVDVAPAMGSIAHSLQLVEELFSAPADAARGTVHGDRRAMLDGLDSHAFPASSLKVGKAVLGKRRLYASSQLSAVANFQQELQLEVGERSSAWPSGYGGRGRRRTTRRIAAAARERI